MKRVLITFSEETRSPEYPLAVVVIHEDGRRSQEHLVKSVRDGRLFANGVCTGATMAAGYGNNWDWPVNAEVDPRLVEV